ncbi:MAG: hypothetical protein H7039_19030 [Bryobacteraceae bacterium]|nr:hypothetical protein [Bryobacteraceae bacterium]
MQSDQQLATWETIQKFIAAAKQPVAFERGVEPMPLTPGNFEIRLEGSRLIFQVWSTEHNLVRQVTAIETSATPGELSLTIEKFGKKAGTLLLLDAAKPRSMQKTKRAGRLAFTEQFRNSLHRQFTGWKIAELTCETDLEHSLSPVHPRAFLRKGQAGWAAIGSATAADADHALTFGLIWLDYLRRRERKITIEGLAIFLPEGQERTTAHRIRHLDTGMAQYRLFVHADDLELPVDCADSGNIETILPDRVASVFAPDWVRDLPGERVDSAGEVSLRIRGLEYARWNGRELRAGIDTRRPVGEVGAPEIRALGNEIAKMRNPGEGDRRNALFAACPERWLESQIRQNLSAVDASLNGPVYTQAPSFAGGERGVLDLVAIGSDGRLTVLEVKASEDIHLPLQALDYWARVKWHLERGEFAAKHYFPGHVISNSSPRLFLLAPALHFHPSTETILAYVTSDAQVERIGLAASWRSELKVVFRIEGRTAMNATMEARNYEGSAGAESDPGCPGTPQSGTGSGGSDEAVHDTAVCWIDAGL